jgi:deazaflavin-dependent oxidoreductase (nitroreductase family)
VFKSPLLLWRMGLSRLMPDNFLILTTWGRKTGQPRHTVLEYTFVDGKFYVSSGWGERAAWYQNLLVDPNVTIQTAAYGTFFGRAERVTDKTEFGRIFLEARGESPLWEEYLDSLGIDDTLGDFLSKRERMLILRIDPDDVAAPPPVKTDLKWLPLVLLAGWLGALLVGRLRVSRLRKR